MRMTRAARKSGDPMADKITVLLVDDHALVRRGFRRMLDDDETLEVVGEASNGAEAVQLADKLRPQVIVMDCQLPEMTGLDATRKILQAQPGYRNSDAQHAFGRYAGASGSRRRSARLHSEKCDGSRSGERHQECCRGTNQSLIQQVSASESAERRARRRRSPLGNSRFCSISWPANRTRRLLLTSNLSVNTVSVHRANIMDRLGIHKTAELVVYAIRNGLVNLP